MINKPCHFHDSGCAGRFGPHTLNHENGQIIHKFPGLSNLPSSEYVLTAGITSSYIPEHRCIAVRIAEST